MWQSFISPRIARNLLFGLIVGASLLRIAICFEHNPVDCLFSDPLRHWHNGARLFSPSYIGASDPIIFEVYVYLLRAISGDNRFIIAGASAFLSVITPWFYYKAAREFGLNKNEGLMVWALLAWTPSLVVIFHYIMIETLLLPIVGLCMWSTGRCLRLRTHDSWILAVLLWTIAILTKTTVLPLAGVCIVYLWVVASKRYSWIISAAAIFLFMLIPTSIRSEKYLGFFAPLGNSWVVSVVHRADTHGLQLDVDSSKYTFSSPSASCQPLRPLSLWMMKRAYSDDNLHVIVNTAHGALDWRLASEKVHVSIREWLQEMGENTVLFLFAPSWPDGDMSTWDGQINYYFRWMWAPLIFFVLDCNIRDFLRGKFHLLPVSVTVLTLFLAFQNVATMEGRYRKPLESLLIFNLIWTFSNQNRKDASIDPTEQLT